MEWMWGMRAKSGVKHEAKVFGLSNSMESPFTGMGKYWGGQGWTGVSSPVLYVAGD